MVESFGSSLKATRINFKDKIALIDDDLNFVDYDPRTINYDGW